MSKIYIYPKEATTEELEEQAKLLGEAVYWKANLSSFHMGKEIPEDWSDQGSIFSQTGELRWQRIGEKYRAILLVDQPLEGLVPLDGDWETEDEKILLQDLSEPRVRPSFGTYPHGGIKGRLRVKVCSKNGVIVWISPREILPEEV